MSAWRGAALLVSAAACLASLGCSASNSAAHSSLDELRRMGPATTDPEVAERWFSAELVSLGGDVKRSEQARGVLDSLKVKSARAHLLRGLDDTHHGRLGSAAEHYLASLSAAKQEDSPHSALVAWYAANEGLGFRHVASRDLWPDYKQFIEGSIATPGFIGWRARAELVDWHTDEAWASATKGVDELTAAEFGCVKQLRMAGPFGRRVAADAFRSFAAEQPGPWPQRWAPAKGSSVEPRQLKTEARACSVAVDEPVPAGVFYAETYLSLASARNLVLVVQGAVGLWVDDQQVLNRDPRKWGEWPRFGVALRLEAGRHRVLARLTDGVTSVRVLETDGRPAEVAASDDASPAYSIVPPTRLADPNALMPFVEVSAGKRKQVDGGDDLLRLIAAELAHVEGQDDVASVLIQPLVRQPTKATGVALASAAVFSAGDPLYDESKGADLVRGLQEAAVRRDPKLWAPRMALILREASTKGLTEGVKPLKALAAEFPEVPGILSTLATLYGQLGWSPERLETVKALAERFPRDPETLAVVAAVYDEQGEFARADKLVNRILELTPDSEIR